MALSSGDIRLILIGLVLTADDEGRELAHAKLLGRELDYDSQVIDNALDELAANDLITLYQVGKHRYYSLQRWSEWETLSKPTPSKYPAPPPASIPDTFQDTPTSPTIPQDFPGDFGETPPEGEGEGEGEKEENRTEGEESETPSNVVTFPTVHTSDTPAFVNVDQVTKDVAAILKLAVNDALRRVIVDYSRAPTLSLLGEADAAREWIDDCKRNRQGQRMTPAFFRRWVKREHEEVLHRQAQRQHSRVTGAHGRDTPDVPSSQRTQSASGLPRSLMDLETTYHQAQQRGGTN